MRDQSRLKTVGGPRQNINEGPHKMNFLVCLSIPLGIEWFFDLQNTNNATLSHFWSLLKL